MSEKIYLDAGALYEKAAEVAERALGVDPEAGYALTDIDDEATLLAALSTPFVGQLLVEGTLTGCIAALAHTPTVAGTAPNVTVAAPQGTAVTTDDMRHAQAILATSISGQLDDSGRSAAIRAELDESYTSNPVRLSSIMLALVVLTEEIMVTAV